MDTEVSFQPTFVGALLAKDHQPRQRELPPEDRELFLACSEQLKPELFTHACQFLGLDIKDGLPNMTTLPAKHGLAYINSPEKKQLERHLRFIEKPIRKKIAQAKLKLEQEYNENFRGRPELHDPTYSYSAEFDETTTDKESGITYGKPKLTTLLRIPGVKTPADYAQFLEKHPEYFELLNLDKEKTVTALKKENWEQVKAVLPEDPRATRLGSMYRQSGLDELPQLIKVLDGEMDLVGPRAQSKNAFNDFALKARARKEPYASVYKMISEGKLRYGAFGDLYAVAAGVANRHTITDSDRMWLSWLSARFMHQKAHLGIMVAVETYIGKKMGIKMLTSLPEKVRNKFLKPKENQPQAEPAAVSTASQTEPPLPA